MITYSEEKDKKIKVYQDGIYVGRIQITYNGGFQFFEKGESRGGCPWADLSECKYNVEKCLNNLQNWC